MTVSWTDLQKWDLSHMRAQYDELANQLSHLGGTRARLDAVNQTIRDGWKGPAGEDAYWAARKTVDNLDHAKQIMDKLKAAVESSEPYVQKAKDAQQHAIDLAAQKQFEIDPVTTELHDLAPPPDPSLFKNPFDLIQYAMRRRQDALEVRNAINEAIRLGEEAEQHADQAICEAAGMPFDPHEKAEDEWRPYPDQLFGKDGKPSSKDTEQNNMGDCTVVSTMAAMADNDPESIKRMISYDPRTGNYNVTFTNKDGTTKTVPVTEAELRANMAIGGGSRVDGKKGDPNAPFWPAVIETAYAKTLPPTDTSKWDPKRDKDKFDQLEQFKSMSPQYGEMLSRISRGAYTPDSLGALTGKPVDHYEQKAAIDPGNVAKFQQAIANHQPVLVSTLDGNKLPDGSADTTDPRNTDHVPNGHAMQVQEVHIDPNTHHVWAEVRNPWGNNNDYPEGNGDNNPATFYVDLTVLNGENGLYAVDVAGK